uniref:Uncharacterized protein LOC111108120 isoform X2 n=1 Tax=Crassostrea virginica TaxID=6565 RepID=A0A8B8B8C1_CRAVI|nr:uncharacterized protein LOC111108120 isoform X2 [Crassostrea virginica]XP_022299404.1 uncharacterized protein LOC111108120 isoform X2 [Crassostrea virginica]
MARSVREIATLVLLVVTFVLWFIAMVTPGWFVFSVETSLTKLEIQMSLFYIKICNNGICASKTYEEFSSYRVNLSIMPEFIELQLEAIAGVILCGICFILMISSSSCSCSKRATTLAVVIGSFIAVVSESILVIRMVDANVKASKILNKAETMLTTINYDMDLNFPYSVLITGVGLVSGVSSFVASIVFRSSLKENSGGQVISMAPVVHP